MSIRSIYHYLRSEVERLFPEDLPLKTKYNLEKDVIEIQKTIRSNTTIDSNRAILPQNNTTSDPPETTYFNKNPRPRNYKFSTSTTNKDNIPTY